LLHSALKLLRSGSAYQTFAIGSRAVRALWPFLLGLLLIAASVNASLADSENPTSDDVLTQLLLVAQQAKNSESSANILRGIRLGLDGRRTTMPDDWVNSFAAFQRRDGNVRREAILLGIPFHHDHSIADAMSQIVDGAQPAEWRSQLIVATSRERIASLPTVLVPLLRDATVRVAAIRGLTAFRVPNIARTLLGSMHDWSTQQQLEVFQLLASRSETALELCKSIEKGDVDRHAVPTVVVRQLRSLKDDELQTRVTAVWGSSRTTPRRRQQQIARLMNLLVAERLAAADTRQGGEWCKKICLNCHRLHGKGADIGPDLSGAQRYDLYYLLHNILDPSAEVDHNFRVTLIDTVDGRTVTGMVVSETNEVVGLQTATERLILNKSEIAERRLSEESMMPNGLLDELSENHIRDLVAFLMMDVQGGPEIQ